MWIFDLFGYHKLSRFKVPGSGLMVFGVSIFFGFCVFGSGSCAFPPTTTFEGGSGGGGGGGGGEGWEVEVEVEVRVECA